MVVQVLSVRLRILQFLKEILSLVKVDVGASEEILEICGLQFLW